MGETKCRVIAERDERWAILGDHCGNFALLTRVFPAPKNHGGPMAMRRHITPSGWVGAIDNSKLFVLRRSIIYEGEGTRGQGGPVVLHAIEG